MPMPGVQQFQVDPDSGAITETWARQDVQCSSSIPAAAGRGQPDKQIFYCVGMRQWQPVGLGSLVLPRHMFTLEALDWVTGGRVFSVDLGSGAFFNPNYAPVQVGSHADIIYGTLGGVVRVSRHWPNRSSQDAHDFRGSLNVDLWPELVLPVFALSLTFVLLCGACCCRLTTKVKAD